MQRLTAKATLLTIAALVSMIGALYLWRGIFLPFIVSMLFAYLLSPLVARIQSFGLKREVAVVLLYLCFIAVFVGALLILLPRVVDEFSVLKNNIPRYTLQIKQAALNLQKIAEKKYPLIKEKSLIDNTVDKLQKVLEEETAKIPAILLGFFSLFSLAVLIPVLTFFILLSGGKFFDLLIELIPTDYVETSLGLIYEIDSVLGKYIRGLMIETTLVAGLTILGLLVLDVDYAVIVGIVAGLANLIPYVGPVAGGLLAVTLGLIKFQSAAIVIQIIVLFLIIHIVDADIVQPVVIGRGVNIPAILIIFSLMLGAKFFGLIGMVFAVPSAAVIKVTLKTLLFKKTSVFDSEKPIIV